MRFCGICRPHHHNDVGVFNIHQWLVIAPRPEMLGRLCHRWSVSDSAHSLSTRQRLRGTGKFLRQHTRFIAGRRAHSIPVEPAVSKADALLILFNKVSVTVGSLI